MSRAAALWIAAMLFYVLAAFAVVPVGFDRGEVFLAGLVCFVGYLVIGEPEPAR